MAAGMTEPAPIAAVPVKASIRARRSIRLVTAMVLPEKTIGSTHAGLIGASPEKIASRGTRSIAAMGPPRFVSDAGVATREASLAVRTGSLVCTVIVHDFCHPGSLVRMVAPIWCRRRYAFREL